LFAAGGAHVPQPSLIYVKELPGSRAQKCNVAEHF